VFNGLQIEGFFTRILARNEDESSIYKKAGELLAELGRNFAPTAAQEMAELQRLDSVLATCDTSGVMHVFD
jgi:hypothetical protein